jgi:hypothetical protein
MLFVTVALIIAGIYLAAGFIFAIIFSWRGAGKIDEGVKNAGWGFRLIIIPGTMLLWPYLFKKWIKVAGRKFNSTAENIQQ